MHCIVCPNLAHLKTEQLRFCPRGSIPVHSIIYWRPQSTIELNLIIGYYHAESIITSVAAHLHLPYRTVGPNDLNAIDVIAICVAAGGLLIPGVIRRDQKLTQCPICRFANMSAMHANTCTRITKELPTRMAILTLKSQVECDTQGRAIRSQSG